MPLSALVAGTADAGGSASPLSGPVSQMLEQGSPMAAQSSGSRSISFPSLSPVVAQGSPSQEFSPEPLVGQSPHSPRFSPEGLAVLLNGALPQRSAAYSTLEGYAARRARDARHAREGSASLAAGCIAPLATILARAASEVDAPEFRRCARCVYDLVSLDAVAVGTEWLRDGRCWTIFASTENAASVAARHIPLEALTQEHVGTLAAVESCFAPLFVRGMELLLGPAEVDDTSDFRREWKTRYSQCPNSRMAQMSTLLVSALRDGDLTGEASVVGGWQLMHALCDERREVALHQVQLGCIELAIAELRKTPASDWVSVERTPSPGRFAAIWFALSNMTSQVSAEHRHLLAATVEVLLGATLDVLRAYETCFNTSDANVPVIYCALSVLKDLRSLGATGNSSADVVRESATSLRFALDHPQVYSMDLNLRTDMVAISVAAEMFGRVEAGASDPRCPGFEFRQDELEAFVRWQLQVLDGTAGNGAVPIDTFNSVAMLSLLVSDWNKNILIRCAELVPMLLLGLFLSQEQDHPRGQRAVPPATPTPENIQLIYQRNHAEAIYHLALCEVGRTLLLQHGQPVVKALQAVGAQGMTEEARTCAIGALQTIGLHNAEGHSPYKVPVVEQPTFHPQPQHQQEHVLASRPQVFLSYHARDQVVMQRLNQSLLRRGYSTCDQQQYQQRLNQTCQADELASCEVILFACSTHYKESPHCRAMAQRGQQMQKPMVALMLEHDCDTVGSWLGSILTTQRRWIALHGPELDSEVDSDFERRTDALVREMESATQRHGRPIAPAVHEQQIQLSEAVPPSPSIISVHGSGVSGASSEGRGADAGRSISSLSSGASGDSGGSRDAGAGAGDGLANDDFGSKVRAMVIASLTDQELATAARARGFSLVKVVNLIGAHIVFVAISSRQDVQLTLAWVCSKRRLMTAQSRRSSNYRFKATCRVSTKARVSTSPTWCDADIEWWESKYRHA